MKKKVNNKRLTANRINLRPDDFDNSSSDFEKRPVSKKGKFKLLYCFIVE